MNAFICFLCLLGHLIFTLLLLSVLLDSFFIPVIQSSVFLSILTLSEVFSEGLYEISPFFDTKSNDSWQGN